jgi:lipid-A-disaccharide synthase-like uncharacterized protein
MTHQFREACESGNLSLVQTLFVDNESCISLAMKCRYRHIIDWLKTMVDNERILTHACIDANMDVVHELLSIGVRPTTRGLSIAARYGHLEVVKMIYHHVEIKQDDNYLHPFYGACFDGHFAVVQWLYEQDSSFIHIPNIFWSVFRHGYMDIAEWLLSRKKDALTMNDVCAAVRYNHLNILKLSRTHTKLDMNMVVDEYVWCDIAKEHYVEMIHYLVHECGATIHSEALYGACVRGHLALAQWMVRVQPTIGGLDKALERAARNNHVEVIRWLLDIHEFTLEAMKMAIYESSQNFHLESTLVLLERDPSLLSEVMRHESIIQAARNNQVAYVKWYASHCTTYEPLSGALYFSVIGGHMECCRCIMTYIEIDDDDHYFYHAITHDKLDMMSLFYHPHVKIPKRTWSDHTQQHLERLMGQTSEDEILSLTRIDVPPDVIKHQILPCFIRSTHV